MKNIATLAVMSVLLSACTSRQTPQEEVCDVVVYGATPGGIAAALQATRMGRSVVLLEPSGRIGGLTTGGLGRTDIGDPESFGGIARKFYRDVRAHYAKDSSWTRCRREEYHYGRTKFAYDSDVMWSFEPSVALAILEKWERDEGVRIVRNARLDRGPGGVVVEAGRIASIRTEDGRRWTGGVFVDATYEGDLMAAAGVSYAVGRESNSTYGETLNGAQPSEGFHKLAKGVDPYVVKGDKSSGLLPGIDPAPMAAAGTGDGRVQAYCFRMCLTDDPENRIPFEKPAGYDERNYELFFRNYEAGADASDLPWINALMPNRKTDTNNRDGFSTDFIGQNHAWPDASYEERERIQAAHLNYQKGLMWTMAYHPRTPKAIRDRVSLWGLCKDEFKESGGWPNQLYLREARRMIGEYVMTEMDCRHQRTAPNPVALGSYQMDSHHVRRYVGADGFVQNEGDVEVACVAGPYGIAYGSIVPKRGECANLLVPVCLSASHIAFGSIRMEPVFFALGQAAGTAASIALDSGCAVQDVDYAALKKRLEADGQRFDARVYDCVRSKRHQVTPPPALMENGTTRESWERVRRPELVKLLLEKEYGIRPVERPADLRFVETAPAEECLGGKAVTKRVRATYSGPGGAAEMNFRVWIPKSSRPVPAFVHSSPRPAETAADPNGPRPGYLLPVEKIVSRGYAAIAYCNQEVALDWHLSPAVPTNGAFKALGPRDIDARAPHEWGILSAWAWGMSRIMDWIETEPLIDAKHVAAVGLSRNGKTALVAGAFDERFALTISCCSGCGGAKLNHMHLPYSESIKQIGIAHRWFSPEYTKEWTGRDRDTPFDQHMLLALVAPRLLYVSSAKDDDWAGPCGEFASALLASPAWELYGEKGLVAPIGFPETDKPLQEGRVGYHFRTGRHAIMSYDWDRYIDFADRHGWRK